MLCTRTTLVVGKRPCNTLAPAQRTQGMASSDQSRQKTIECYPRVAYKVQLNLASLTGGEASRPFSGHYEFLLKDDKSEISNPRPTAEVSYGIDVTGLDGITLLRPSTPKSASQSWAVFFVTREQLLLSSRIGYDISSEWLASNATYAPRIMHHASCRSQQVMCYNTVHG